jgi:hypothetical protein
LVADAAPSERISAIRFAAISFSVTMRCIRVAPE